MMMLSLAMGVKGCTAHEEEEEADDDDEETESDGD